jgi:glutathionyl-hydroquinone reductase
MLNGSFDGSGGDRSLDLVPTALRSEVDDLVSRLDRRLAIAVYIVAGARNQHDYGAAMDELFHCLDGLEGDLRDGRLFLLGDRPTLAASRDRSRATGDDMARPFLGHGRRAR